MLMKKFVGATAREAMQKMKADLGPEALVISNRKIAAGIEILAMVEPEVSAAGRRRRYRGGGGTARRRHQGGASGGPWPSPSRGAWRAIIRAAFRSALRWPPA